MCLLMKKWKSAGGASRVSEECQIAGGWEGRMAGSQVLTHTHTEILILFHSTSIPFTGNRFRHWLSSCILMLRVGIGTIEPPFHCMHLNSQLKKKLQGVLSNVQITSATQNGKHTMQESWTETLYSDERRALDRVNAGGKGRQKWLTTAATKLTKPGAHHFSSALYIFFLEMTVHIIQPSAIVQHVKAIFVSSRQHISKKAIT